MKAPESPVLIGSFPEGVTPANFKYVPSAARLVFSAYVFEDGDLSTVKEQNEAYEKRGNTALVYDETYERHWDTWVGPKRSKLFTVKLAKDPSSGEKEGKWTIGEFGAPMKSSKHETPVEPFGGTDDYDVSEGYIVYTAKDPELPPAMHTKQNVRLDLTLPKLFTLISWRQIYLLDILGANGPRELTSGDQGATHTPVFSPSGTKVAWISRRHGKLR